MEYDDEALEYIRELETNNLTLSIQLETEQIKNHELAREVSVLQEKLDEYRGPL